MTRSVDPMTTPFPLTGPLVLASGSVARRALLSAAGLSFSIVTSDIDESLEKDRGRKVRASADDVALTLAREKALNVSRHHEGLVIGADQMLSCDGEWFDKPATLSDARTQLLRLRDRTHHLHSAVVLCRGETVLWTHVERPALTMRAFSDSFLDSYLATEGEACLSSVGAYRLEGPGIQLFSTIEGEHSAILGLPMLPLLAALREAGALSA